MYSKLKFYFANKNVDKVIIALFSLVYILLNYPYLFEYPTGIHFIRATDTISFSLYYLHVSDYDFFNVGNLNLGLNGGRAACEFPLFYYLYFLIFKAVGIKLVLIRWFSLLLTSISIYCLANSLLMFFDKLFLSIFVVLLIISSSVFRYYSLNFLPDSLAISFLFIGLSFFIKYFLTKKENLFYYAFIFFTIASLLKIYYGIYLILSMIYIIIDLRKLSLKPILIFSCCCLSIAAWYLYSVFYNFNFHSDYYLTHSVPIWKMTSQEIDVVLGSIFGYWNTKYFLPTIFHAFFLFFIILFIPKIISPKIRLFLFCGIVLNIVYVLLFFRQFRDHDYYFIPIIPMFFLITVFCIDAIIKFFENKIVNAVVVILIGIISVLGFNYTSLNIYRRFNNTIDSHSIVAYQLKNADKFLDSLNINFNSTFMVVGDITPNGSLVFLNRFGWTYPNFTDGLNKIENNLTEADYLLVLKPSANRIPENISAKLKNCQSFSYYNNYIYSLKNYNR